MKILVATDGSEHSQAAVEKCFEIIAESKKSAIRIVSAVEFFAPVSSEPFDVSTESINRIEAVIKRQAAEAIVRAEEFIQQHFPEAANNVTTKVAIGSADRVIVEEAHEWGADLIVVGSHGYGFWERMLLGSVSDAVVHHAPCSVLIVRKKK
jgi:nucleotide-binding universal stress UspA family protein